jgi:hypothetical protein
MKKTFPFLLAVLFSTSAFSQWTSGGTLLSNGADTHHRPMVAAIPDGSAYFTWMGTSTTPVNSIYLAGIDYNGFMFPGWPGGGTVISQAGDFYAPVVIASEDSCAIVAWYGYQTGLNHSHIFVQKFSKQGSPLWNSGNPVKVSGGSVHHHKYPIIVTDRSRGVYLTWMRYDSVVSSTSPDVFLQHIDSSGNVAAGWSITGTPVANTAGVREYYPRLALSPDGNSIYIQYSEGLVGSTSLKLKRINTNNGSIDGAWPAAGLVLSPGPYVYPGIINDQFIYCDDQNNAISFWIEARNSGNGEIYMQRTNPAGSIMLLNHGKCIGANTTEGTSYLEIAQDEDANFLITFNDYSVSYDVDAIKMAPDGNAIWQNLTVTTNNHSAYPKPVSDGNGGMYIFYKYVSGSPYHLYALALDSLGNAYTGWTVPGTDFGGVDTYDAYNPNYDFDVTATRSHRAIAAWDRPDGGPDNIYTCNLLPDGSDCNVPMPFVPPFSSDLNGVFPNPFTDELYIKNVTGEIQSAGLFDACGRLLIQKEINHTGLTTVSTGGLSGGLYFYILENKNGSLQTGLVVK